ncbi:YqcI/YcgG family protein [Halobacillus yeomjeoni]|uniref:YqcI/YcgG family protein n=1 Tax=Halobacillus yeomjeoni TaxID=311194 RepID=A0A931MW04_9BACI|nr:YqcI/YcgG family protein [Halobacillus yeomjeoni]MBH0230969.1 YqcI/YcgG family protein [Halobacillus yeomjeoni]
MLLYSKSWIEKHKDDLEPWQQSAYEEFAKTMTDKENPYPCVPGIQGFIQDSLRFCFAGNPEEESSIKRLSAALKEYGTISRDTGRYASIVIFFETSKQKEYDIESFQHLFWSLLNRIHHYDGSAWPEDIPKNPHHHDWEFCFEGEPYFAFCATPAHTIRKSRYFPFFALAFQPRWVFEDINADTPFGRKLKNVIRKRLLEYDGVRPHPDLKWYGQEDNHEWKQYFLRDDETSMSRCPFSTMKNEIKNRS